MTVERDTTRIVRSWLRADEHESADRVLQTVLARLDTTPQRRSWWPPRRSAKLNSPLRVAVLVAAALVVALIGFRLLPSNPDVGVQPTPGPTITPAPTAPVETPAATPIPLSSTAGALPVGSVVLDGPFPLAIVFDVPAGWSRQGTAEAAGYVGVHKVRGDLSPAWSSWAIIANVYPDPCHAESGPADPPIGPTVDDLVAAMTTMAGIDATNPTDVTVDGYAGKRFQLSTTIEPAADGCDDPVWLPLWEPAGGGETAAVPSAANMQFWVLDVDGTRLVMFTEAYDATEAEIAESIDILESVRFE